MNKILSFIKAYYHYREQNCSICASYIHAKIEMQHKNIANSLNNIFKT